MITIAPNPYSSPPNYKVSVDYYNRLNMIIINGTELVFMNHVKITRPLIH